MSSTSLASPPTPETLPADAVPSSPDAKPAASGTVDLEKEEVKEHHVHPLAMLSPARKNILLLIFSISGFIDVCNVSGAGVAVAQISGDIHLGLSQLVWIITSYSLCFAAFLLFAGRLSDLFPAQIIFETGFFALGIFTLALSFVTSNKYGFLILRGLAGISGSLTIPSAFHLTVHMFPDPKEQASRLALLGLAGALGNVMGLVLAGLTMLARYTWFFRLLAILCIVFSVLTVFLLPYTPSSYKSTEPRYKRMDVVGVLLMTGCLICFILSLTQGPIDGWGSASFIAPFIIAFVLGPLFFVWEVRIPPKTAVLPSSVWLITNIVISSVAVLYPFAFWVTSQLQYATYWQEVLHWKPIHVAAAMLPQGITALIVGGGVQGLPQIITAPRISIPVGATLIIAGELLQIFSNGGHGMDYWKYCFPGFCLGSAGALISYFASAINLITTCPPEMAGVASAWTQVLAQVGGAVALAVQAGLQGDNLADWKVSSARGFYFMIAFVAVLAAQYVIFYRKPQAPEIEHELARQRIKEAHLALD